MGKAAVQNGWLSGIKSNGGSFWTSSIHESFVLGFIYLLIPHRPLRLRETTKVLGMGRNVSFLIWESLWRCRECSVPDSVTTKEGGLHVMTVGKGIVSQLTQIETRIIMG